MGTYRFGCLNVLIEQDYDAASVAAGRIFLSELREKKDGVFGFATGSTPLGLYGEIVKAAPDMSGVTTFNLDEYYPIKRTDSQSYYRFMWENLFDHVNVNRERVHLPDGEAKDPAAECLEFERKIEGAGGIDLQVLGIGMNGHIGFNEPSDSFADATHCVSLTESTIQANSRFFAEGEQIPLRALTMGIGTILRSKKILFIATGNGKSGIVQKMLQGPVGPALPASILRFHRDATVILDEAAAAGLK